jgi:cytoskeletal protein CcmA (bactofilin family)
MKPRAHIVAVLAVLALVVVVGAAAGQPAGVSSGAECCGGGKSAITATIGGFQFCQTNRCDIPVGDTLEKDLYTWTQTLTIDGTLDGDLTAWFQSGTINGAVTQDLNVFAQDLTVSGEVGDDIRAIANNMNILGTVKGNVLAAGSFVRVGEGAVIDGDLLVGAGTVTIDGEVKGAVRIGTGHLTLNGTIGGDAHIATDGGITMGNDATIGGDLHYEGPAQIEFSHGAVKGAITFKAKDEDKELEDIQSAIGRFTRAFGIVMHIFLWIAALIAGSVLFAFTKEHANRTAEILRTKPLKSLGIGFIAAICVPIVCLIMLVLVLTIPLSFIVFLVYLVAVYIAKFYVGTWLGKLILRNRPAGASPIPPMLLGVSILYLLTWIPVLGFLITLVVVFFGLGALLQRKETRLNGAFESATSHEPPGLPETLPAGPQG